MTSIIVAQIWPYLLGALALVAGLLGYGSRERSKGRAQERIDAKEADYEAAAEIRDRVERDLDERVRSLDDAGWRD